LLCISSLALTPSAHLHKHHPTRVFVRNESSNIDRPAYAFNTHTRII
jgi:hypothetical protein